MRAIVTARQQVEMLSPFVFASKLIMADYGARLRELNKRHRFSDTDNEAVRRMYPPLSDDEHAERNHLRDWSSDLRNKYDGMEPMTDDELESHRQLNGEYRDGKTQLPLEPSEMTKRQRLNRYTELRPYSGETGEEPWMTPRQQSHYDQIKPEAEEHFSRIHEDAKDDYKNFHDYLDTGEHYPEMGLGQTSIKGQDTAHSPLLTNHWAAEMYQNGTGALHRRAKEYHEALQNVVQNGPQALNVETGKAHHEELEDTRNAMRAELQHKSQFRVPFTDLLSKHPDGPNVGSSPGTAVVNPRYAIGTGDGDNVAHKEAYKVNCQRATLAGEARSRGYNVEAAPNYSPRGGGRFADQQFGDHEIANWFRDPATGEGGTWQDAQDEFPGTPKGPKLWDKMNDHIASWGPGARGVVTRSYSSPGGGYARHIFNAHVGDDGTVTYPDHQTGEADTGAQWRKATGYRLHGRQNSNRELAKGGMASGLRSTRETINKSPSPLRFMRTDDKDLAPDASRHMIDRGTHPDTPISPVNPYDA